MRCPHGARYAGKSDEQLMVEFYRCDAEAFDELWWCRYKNKMSRYVARKVPIRDVEDILQDAAIKVCETKHRPSARYDPHKGPLQSWLFRIVENAMRDRFRHSKHSESEILLSDLQAEIMEEGEEGEVPDPPEFAVAEINEEKIAIQDAVRRLSEPSRTIVQRKFWDDSTIGDIANDLGMSVATVHRKLEKDLERLKEMLS
ncbi:sigma-70 family RNA polymerase sigma factor (plasmid) [Fervidibacter sacchari]|uniref:RNA polymerase sigma factor (Sigma-70 family) n=1 Tax=Candidatus Fervidibacter sacchari TaxID=1448929 RepID=A0ABT2ETX8_9BACT|nr:sigma-70 family RNA polymerase sigma factor [Candidatus Fervidibacter sacchari]MCS3921315.1 RNA polymerase sigma factor (sigma-70 family) [Candidatus Fervidibacter sacchari]WKU18087.1 sigma-70 family RNA polymerase sigma factor [Candidatus Fervidibacter sacchari]